MSLAAYLDRIGASGFIRSLLEVAYVTEYGLDPDQQSALNLVFLIGTDIDEGFRIFGDSDERYRIAGGSEAPARALTTALDGQIHTGHALEAIRPNGAGYRLTFAAGAGARDVDADAVVLAIPFTTLRRVSIGVPLPEWKRRAIDELGYGMNSKLFAGMRGRPWREAGFSAEAFTDGDVQLCWDPTESQQSAAACLTIYSGGAAGVAAGAGTPEERVAGVLPALDALFPGTAAAYTGTAARFHWPTHPWTLASYACYRPGQWTTIAGAEIKPVGRLFFAGEHASYDFQGYMNGAVETDRRAAASVLDAVGRPAFGIRRRPPQRSLAA
jgi:monoamine oxidase